jgi:signal transduction histidine kinase
MKRPHEAKQESRRAELNDALLRINALINSTLVIDEIMRRIVREAVQIIGCDSSFIVLQEEGHDGHWRVQLCYRLPHEIKGRSFSDYELPQTVLASNTKAPVAVSDTSHDERVNPEIMKLLGVKSLLAIPLIVREKAIGNLSLNYHAREVAFTDLEIDFASELASSISLAMSNAALYEKLKKSEEALRQSDERLRMLVKELNRSNEDLRQFAYIVSHDLSEPLRTVSGFLELIASRYKGKLDEKADTYISFAVEGAKRMSGLIHDLVAYSRVGTRAREFAPVVLDAILKQVENSLHKSIEESGARITSDPLPVVHGDKSQLTVLLQSLIVNAIKFRKKENPAQIRITAEQKGNEWLFGVHDNGIGIDPRFRDRIFIIFQRLHTREEFPGTGVGLAICKKIVERHGGRIWVESQEGKGTSFYFTLPSNSMDRHWEPVGDP